MHAQNKPRITDKSIGRIQIVHTGDVSSRDTYELLSLDESKDLIGSVLENMKIVEVCKVPHELHKQFDVRSLVQQIGVSELLRKLISNSLEICTGAITVLADDRVLDHGALLTNEVLHLVGDKSSIHKL